MEFLDFRLPAEGFGQPLMLWLACHQRAERVALLLQRLLGHLAQHGAGEPAQVTAAEVLRYMDQAMPRHHADEDIDLFPRLRRALDATHPPGASETTRALDRLAHDHDHLDDLWQRVRGMLASLSARAPASSEIDDAGRFVDEFLTHHGIEDRLIAPVATIALRPRDLIDIGESMAARRGTTWSALSLGTRAQ